MPIQASLFPFAFLSLPFYYFSSFFLSLEFFLSSIRLIVFNPVSINIVMRVFLSTKQHLGRLSESNYVSPANFLLIISILNMSLNENKHFLWLFSVFLLMSLL